MPATSDNHHYHNKMRSVHTYKNGRENSQYRSQNSKIWRISKVTQTTVEFSCAPNGTKKVATGLKDGETPTLYTHLYRISFLFVYTTTHCSLKACAILVRRSDFRHQASPRVSPCESTQRRKVELWARNVREFCLNVDFHITFMDLLHAVKLRNGTDGFTSPPK